MKSLAKKIIGWWCEKLEKSVQNAIAKPLSFIRIKALKEKEDGFLLHGFALNVHILITLHLTLLCIKSEENNITISLKRNVLNVV